jgi:hypothetical protein
MADDRTKNQTNRVTEATAADATKTGADTSADVVRKGAEATQRTVDAGAEQAEKTARTGAKVAQRTIEAGAEQGQQVAEAGVQQARRLLESSSDQLAKAGNQATRVVREGTQRTNEILEIAMKVASTAASGSQSVTTELVGYGRQAFKRNVDALNQALRVRSTTDLLNIQTSYLHDSLSAALNTSAKISEISARTAAEAAGKLEQHRSA